MRILILLLLMAAQAWAGADRYQGMGVAAIGYLDAATISGTVPAGQVGAAGSDGYIQYNSGGLLGAESDFSYNATTNTLTLNGPLNVSDTVTVDAGTEFAFNGSAVFDTNSGGSYVFKQGTNNRFAITGTSGSWFLYPLAVGLARVAENATLEVAGVVSSTGGVTVVGDITATGVIESGGTRTVLISETATGTKTLDVSANDSFRLTLSGNTTISLTNPPPAGTYAEKSIKVLQNGTTSYTLAFPSNVLWSYGASPTTQPSLSSINRFVLTTDDGGTTYEGYWAGQFLQ